MGTLSVVIITRNEGAKIRRCLQSVAWANELVVVDGGSTDATLDVCGEFGAKIHRRELDTFDRQKNFGLEQATGRWVLSLDADEVVSTALRAELCATLARDGGARDGFVLRRENYLCGRPIRHVWGRDALVRLVRNGRGRFHGEVHEKLRVEGAVGELLEPLLHFNSADLREYVAKNHRYTRLDAAARHRRGDRIGLGRALLSAVRVFLFRYVTLRGFRDGRMGLVLCVLLAFFTFRSHVRLRGLGRSERAR